MSKKALERVSIAVMILGALFILFFYRKNGVPVKPSTAAPHSITVERQKPQAITSPIAISFDGSAEVSASSSPVFAYAHGTAQADGRFFIGMSDTAGNAFPANQITVFTDPNDLSRTVMAHLSRPGGVETMAYDSAHDRIYFALSDNGRLEIYSIDPHTYKVSAIISTSTVDAGSRPAIVTDGTYIYGITETDPSTVFKVRISDGDLATSSAGHIPEGHSAAIGTYGSSTELYFGGGMSDQFEKVRASDLAPLATIDVGPCLITNDMPYAQTDDRGGYVYLGCEEYPYGIRVNTSGMATAKFALPGESLGMFIFGNDLYNTDTDGAIDVFRGLDVKDLKRYRIMNGDIPFQDHGMAVQPNEIFFSSSTQSLYFTAWWGVKGIYRIGGLQ